MTSLRFDFFDIDFPDQVSGVFSIFTDLTAAFGVSYQSEAYELLVARLKDKALRPKPNLDYESDYTDISSRSAQTIFRVACTIHELTLPHLKSQMSQEELADIEQALTAYKRPKKKKWQVGDVFAMPLKTGEFGFGQVVGTYLAASPIVAVFDVKSDRPAVRLEELRTRRVICVWNSEPEELAKGIYPVLYQADLLAFPEQVRHPRRSGGAAMHFLVEVYFGIEPYNALSDNYFDDYWQPEIGLPEHRVYLDEEALKQYRKERFPWLADD